MNFSCKYIVTFSVLFGTLNGIDIKKCPLLPAPNNGHVICDNLLGAFCAPVCESGFNFETTPASAYVCNPMRKSWATYPAGYPLPWPNCINLTSPMATTRYSVPIKKSQVNQMISRPLQSGITTKNESLWQRMLKLTSELTQKKLKGLTKGAARSDLDNDQTSNYNNENSYAYPTASTNIYQTTNEIPQTQSANQETEFKKLQQYWNVYYKNYYKSLSINADNNKNPPDWTLQSPWSNDPEHVEGALDKDFSGKDQQANKTTIYQNWNSYLQSFYQYPTQSYYKPNSTDYYSFQMPNSSSDHFIDNIISNDLQSKKISDASINRDLYYEDRLIQMEESKRPFLNVTKYMPTPVSKINSTQSARQLVSSANNSMSYYYAETQNNTTFAQYPGVITPHGNANSPVQSTNNTSSSFVTVSQTTPRSKQIKSNNSIHFKDSSLGGSSTAPDRGYAAPSHNKNVTNVKSNNYSNQFSTNKLNSTLMSTDDYEAPIFTPVPSAIKKPKNYSSNPPEGASATKSNSDVPVESYTTQNSVDDQDDDTDYLDELDITALVRELIKLESIRKQKKMRRRKKIEKDNMKFVGNMLVGDVFKGYFKNKKLRSQKALKKQLLNKAKMLIKTRAKGPPLPKFS